MCAFPVRSFVLVWSPLKEETQLIPTDRGGAWQAGFNLEALTYIEQDRGS